MKTLKEKMDLLKELVLDGNIRKAYEGVSTYYIFTYDPKQELEVRDYIKELNIAMDLKKEYELKVFDLYDMMLDLIEEEGLYEACVEMEETEGMDYLISAVSDVLMLDYDDNYFNTYINDNTPSDSIVFITGIGKLFPFVKAEKILNKLKNVYDRVSVILFYPGDYKDQNLTLFSEIESDDYCKGIPI